MNASLASKQCVPCKGGVPPLTPEEQAPLLKQLDGWEVIEGHHLSKKFKFPSFPAGLGFVSKIVGIAEEQGHHPDIHFTIREVKVEIWTHKINGLTESDFVLAAKIDQL